MKKFVQILTIGLGVFPVLGLTATPPRAVNSFLFCRQAVNLEDAVSEVNGALAMSEITARISGEQVAISDFVGTQPSITRVNAGLFIVCVTLQRK
jgi:hypothetical protein